MAETPSHYPPPLTLTAQERKALQAFGHQAQRRFEEEATRLECIEGKSQSDAEAGAFELIVRQYRTK